MNKILLLFFFIILFISPSVFSQFSIVTQIKITDLEGNEITDINAGQIFKIMLDLKNTGQEDIKTGKIMFISYVKSSIVNRFCGPAGTGLGGVIGTKPLSLKVGEQIKIIAWGMFNEKIMPGKYQITSYVDATGNGAYPPGGLIYNYLNVKNLKEDWIYAAADQITGIKYYPESGDDIPNYKPTQIGEKYSKEYTIKNYNPKYPIEVNMWTYKEPGCDNGGKYLPVTVPAGSEIKVKFDNCVAYAGFNHNTIYLYSKDNKLIVSATGYYLLLDKIIGYSGFYLKKGPLMPGSLETVYAKIRNYGTVTVPAGTKILLQIYELKNNGGSYTVGSKLIEKEYALDKELVPSQITQLSLEFPTLANKWIYEYRLMISLRNEDGKDISNYGTNYIQYIVIADVFATINQSTFKEGAYIDGATTCIYSESSKEKAYECTVKKSGLVWILFDFDKPEFYDLNKLKISSNYPDPIGYKVGSLYVYDDPLNGQKIYEFSVPNKASGFISAPDISWTEGFVLLFISIIVFGIYSRVKERQ